MKLANQVQAWLDHLEWNDKVSLDEENQTSSVTFIYIINEQPFKVWVETYEKTNTLTVYLYAPFKALPNKLDECKLLFNHINNFSTWGAIACDDEKGTIRWRHSVDFKNTDPSVAAIDSAFRVGGDIFKNWFDQISFVAITKTTAQSIIDHSKNAPEPEGIEAFDKHMAAQGYPSPLKSLH